MTAEQFARRARGRTSQPGKMNRTESRYAAHLEARRLAGEITWFAFEPWKFRLADRTFLTPDFGVMLADGLLECHEVKGFWEDDARVKIKVAAEQHWMFRWLAVQEAKGRWTVEAFG